MGISLCYKASLMTGIPYVVQNYKFLKKGLYITSAATNCISSSKTYPKLFKLFRPQHFKTGQDGTATRNTCSFFYIQFKLLNAINYGCSNCIVISV
jgi:hypothetical protein